MKNDNIILRALEDKRLIVDAENGKIYNFFGDELGHVTGRYQRVTVRYNGKDHQVTSHRVIWMAVHGPIIPENLTVDHIDGNKMNNRISNLQLLTEKENIQKAWRDRKEKALAERGTRKSRDTKKAEHSRAKQDSAK